MTTPRGFVVVKPLSSPGLPSAVSSMATVTPNFGHMPGNGPSTLLPLWFYNVPSSRDGNGYFGMMVGQDPFRGGGTTKIGTFIVPVVFTINTIGVSVDPQTGVITTAPGVTTFDPTKPDNNCLAAPNNVPVNLFRQSPIFENTKFTFGGTHVGTTQYIDAFQRANFWEAMDDRNDYHVLLNPVTILPPLVLNVPAQYGTTLPNSLLKKAPCGPDGIVDINWFDSYIVNNELPALAALGVTSGTLPIFQFYNTILGVTPVANLNDCCILGYHGAAAPPVQTYAVADFDVTSFWPAGAQDTSVLSHEIGEWMNDPFGFNPTLLWGNTGQVQGSCQGNLEVGDPLTGTTIPNVKMPNGFTYHLQELAFYSWFLGKPSVGVNGWYSNNGTFLTDAGPTCQ